jgi:ketosteroid isomerase-like protein
MWNIHHHMKRIVLLTLLCLLFACGQKENKQAPVEVKPTQLTATEKELQAANADFSKMCNEEGLVETFNAYASKDVILMREGELPVIGIDSVGDLLSKKKGVMTLRTGTDRIRVSANNELGYVYGPWAMVSKGKDGTEKSRDGYYTSVWRIQADSTWKFELFCMTSNKPKGQGEKNK